MKIIDIYNKYKKEYKKYVIIIESGFFYYVLNDDCEVINKLLDYKIKYLCGNFSICFSINSINKVTEKLKTKEINCLVLKKSSSDYVIDEKNKENNNNYGNYLNDCSKQIFLVMSE